MKVETPSLHLSLTLSLSPHLSFTSCQSAVTSAPASRLFLPHACIHRHGNERKREKAAWLLLIFTSKVSDSAKKRKKKVVFFPAAEKHWWGICCAIVDVFIYLFICFFFKGERFISSTSQCVDVSPRLSPSAPLCCVALRCVSHHG